MCKYPEKTKRSHSKLSSDKYASQVAEYHHSGGGGGEGSSGTKSGKGDYDADENPHSLLNQRSSFNGGLPHKAVKRSRPILDTGGVKKTKVAYASHAPALGKFRPDTKRWLGLS